MNRRQFIALAAAALPASHTLGLPAADTPAQALGRKLAADPLRPRFHFLPPANWMNDPNGPIFWEGFYHLFYQYNPHGAFWGDMHWGHARGRDLVHWQHLPVAMAPTPGGPDKGGCFSGSAFTRGGAAWFAYTGVSPEVQCLASARGELLQLQKYPSNPVVSAPPPGMRLTGFRDPSVWFEHGAWWMTVGAGTQGQGGMVLLYRSADALRWNFLHPLCTGPQMQKGKLAELDTYDAVAAGDMWECPDYFDLGGGRALLFSTQGSVYYQTGRQQADRFIKRVQGLVDGGEVYYAAKSFAAAPGRRILWGWVREARTNAAQRAAGWAGVLSLPRLLSLSPEGLLTMEPAPELRMLRGDAAHIENTRLAAGATENLPMATGDSLEIQVEISPGSAQEAGLLVRRSPGEQEFTRIAYLPGAGLLRVDTRHSSLDSSAFRKVYETPLHLPEEKALRLTVFVDASMIEIFSNAHACITARVYPMRADSMQTAVYCRGGPAHFPNIRSYPLRAISNNRLTT